MKKLLIISFLIFSSLAVFASDLIIESKTQVFSDKEKKIKLDGGVKVKMDNLTVESPRAEVSIRRGNKLDTATFFDKPYAFEIDANKTTSETVCKLLTKELDNSGYINLKLLNSFNCSIIAVGICSNETNAICLFCFANNDNFNSEKSEEIL